MTISNKHPDNEIIDTGKMQHPVCAECGSNDIEAHAQLYWSNDLQDWQVGEVLDRCNCANCGNTDARMHFVDLSDDNNFQQARARFAGEKTNQNAARLLRAALTAHSVDLINDEEQEGVMFDVIDYLER